MLTLFHLKKTPLPQNYLTQLAELAAKAAFIRESSYRADLSRYGEYSLTIYQAVDRVEGYTNDMKAIVGDALHGSWNETMDFIEDQGVDLEPLKRLTA